jgi:hypothetical protein
MKIKEIIDMIRVVVTELCCPFQVPHRTYKPSNTQFVIHHFHQTLKKYPVPNKLLYEALFLAESQTKPFHKVPTVKAFQLENHTN